MAVWREKGSPLTSGQQAQLSLLYAAGALDRASAKGPFDDGMARANPHVIGALWNKGLALSRVVRVGGRGGSQQTLYWLTSEGVTAAAELKHQPLGAV